jgi:uncharacterized protein with FMN-binding domain
MRRLTLWIVSTIAGVVLLLSYRTSLGDRPPAPVSGPAPGIVPESGAPPSAGSKVKVRALTVNGTVADTRWGPVQVQATIENHKITDVRVLRRPTGSDRDDEINGYALPRLRAEVLSAQSADVDAVSGATVTSGGYRESLQAALDAAHFG